MFDPNDEQYLLRLLNTNRVVLFLGAGFSHEATNKLGNKLPLGNTLSEKIWEWLGYDGEYDGTALPDMFDGVLTSGKKESEIATFFENHYLCDVIPDKYDALTSVYWYRVYTTNVDDLIEQVYRKIDHPKLDILKYPHDEIHDRDQTLARMQYIKLNGSLPCKPEEMTFSIRQYAARSNEIDVLYQQFVRDYCTLPTIFIGTELAEYILWQYISVREKKTARISENRPKSFLIAPSISPPKRNQLESFNIVPVLGTAFDFLEWLNTNRKKLSNRIEILKTISPDIADVIGKTLRRNDKTALINFTKSFHQVPITAQKSKRSMYLLGASPTWEDILDNLDAPRNITTAIEKCISDAYEGKNELNLFAILGSAGSGKSTILRRVGLNLARAGRTIFITNSEELPKIETIVNAINIFEHKIILLFDNSEVCLSYLPSIVSKVKELKYPPAIVIASRTNDYDRRVSRYKSTFNIKEFEVPNLEVNEIKSILQILGSKNMLGKLQGMSDKNRIAEFEMRANKQILVAMREATSGRGFDEILRDEFETLVPQETQILYLCVALATDAGYRLTIQEFVGCAECSPAEALHYLERNLKNIVLQTGQSDDLLGLRHRKIAEVAIEQFAPRRLLREAYIRVLSVLASEITGKHWSSRTFGFYKELVNHLLIYKRFSEDFDQARTIYDALASYFKFESQFWLQYGSLELEADNLELAENYLNQAESLEPDDLFVSNAKAHLMLKKGIKANTKAEAIKFRDDGSKILLENIYNSSINDPYCYHIYCSQRHKWLHKWINDRNEIIKELEDLRNKLSDAVKIFPKSRQIVELHEMIEREYLSMALPGK